MPKQIVTYCTACKTYTTSYFESVDDTFDMPSTVERCRQCNTFKSVTGRNAEPDYGTPKDDGPVRDFVRWLSGGKL